MCMWTHACPRATKKNMDLQSLGVALLVVFVLLAAVDGVYLHLWRFRLHEREGSKREHRLHTARAVLFPITVVLVFTGEVQGFALWAGVVLVLVDSGFAALDVWEEASSRGFQGGLPRAEFRLHVVLTVLHVAATAAVLASRPAEAWAFDAPLVAPSVHWTAAWLNRAVLPGAVGIAMLHLWLALPAGVSRGSGSVDIHSETQSTGR